MENQYVVFKLFNQFCVLDLSQVIEVCHINTLVKTNAKELNVMIWHNRSIPIIDPTAMMSKIDKTQEITTKSKVIIVKPREDMKEIGIMVDAVVGIDEIEPEEMLEASFNDARYIVGRVSRKAYQLKLLSLQEFLKTNVVEKFPIVYGMKSEELNQGLKMHGETATGKEEVVENMRLKAINWLIRAIKNDVEDVFIIDMKKIYDLTLQL